MSILADTLKIHNILTKEVGFNEKKAEAFIRLFDEEHFNVATKADIARLELRLTSLEAQLRMQQWMIGGIGFGILILIFERFVL